MTAVINRVNPKENTCTPLKASLLFLLSHDLPCHIVHQLSTHHLHQSQREPVLFYRYINPECFCRIGFDPRRSHRQAILKACLAPPFSSLRFEAVKIV